MKYLCLICADPSAMMEFMSPADSEKHFNSTGNSLKAYAGAGSSLPAIDCSRLLQRLRCESAMARCRQPTALSRKPRNTLAAIT